ncbi:MAG: very short patch repair endonuclease [Deltaproteobacteria bacterium]|nr:very short patch repair endonuclease [Deltaproteobacteria bacterium]
MDTVSPKQRSKIMAKVRSVGNKSTELAVIKVFRILHISGWRRQYQAIGKPDFCFPKQKIAVFVDGCFWHGCPKHCRMPATNRKYWNQKIARNVQHDGIVGRELRKRGWKVVRIWEHELQGGKELTRKMKRIKDSLIICA